MSIESHNGPSYLRRARERSGLPNQLEPTQPIVSDLEERPRSVPVGSLLPERIVSTATEALRQFDRGDISKSLAVARITFALGLTDERNSSKERALQSYLEQLDQIEHVQHRTPSGSSRTAQSRGEIVQSASRRHSPHRSPVHPRSGAGSREHTQVPFQFNPDDSDGSSDAGGGSYASDESGSDTGRPDRKRPKLRESDMPWYEEEKRGGTEGGQRESCCKTRKLLRKFSQDVGRCKQWVVTSASAPVGFPTSEWEHILRGRAVNLDAVLSAVFHLEPVEENTGNLGGIFLPYARPRATSNEDAESVRSSTWAEPPPPTALAL